MDTIPDILKVVSGSITSLLVIVAFLVSLIKPLRNRFTNWVMKQAQTEGVMKRLTDIDEGIQAVCNDVTEIRENLKEHAEQNSIDIRNSNAAHMFSLRCQIREIYTRNYVAKQLTMREQRDVYDLYDAYTALGGNGYIKAMLEEMKTWRVCAGM